jgi:translation initiation factor IF-2
VEPPVAKKLKESPQAKAALAKKGEKEAAGLACSSVFCSGCAV